MNIKKWRINILLVLMVPLLLKGNSVMSAESKEKEVMSWLKTNEETIINEEGIITPLRGTNIGGWLIQESWMTPTNSAYQLETIKVLTERFGEDKAKELINLYEDNYFTEKDLDYLQELGVNCVRVPFTYLNLCDRNGELLDNPWKRIDWIIDECSKRSIYVILDLHGAMGSQNGNDHSGDASNGARLFENEDFINHTVWLWEQIANRYKESATVAGYDLLNEPGGVNNKTGKVQWEVFNRLYQSIRDIDEKHMIFIESCWEPRDLPNPQSYGWENIVYEYHNYCWNADDDFEKQRHFVDDKLLSVENAGYNVPTLIGEFTSFINTDAWKYTLGMYNKAGFSWTTWTYKVTGNSSWGIINHNSPKVDIYLDDFDTIYKKWSLVGDGEVNNKYTSVIQTYLHGETLVPEKSEPMPVPKPLEIKVPLKSEKKQLPVAYPFILGVIIISLIIIVGLLRKKR